MNIRIIILALALSLTLPLLAQTRDIAQSYALESQADFIGSLEIMRELSAADPQEPFYQVRIAWLEYLLGRYERSISSYRKAIGLRDNLDARVGIINCHLALGDYRLALSATDSLLVEHRQNPQLLAKAAYAAYLLKEQLRLVFQHRGDEAVAMLDAWLAWARRCQIPAFVELYHRIKKHRAGIVASVTHDLSNGLTESVNTKLRLLTRIAYGFRSTDNLIALCLLDRGGHCPALPGRK